MTTKSKPAPRKRKAAAEFKVGGFEVKVSKLVPVGAVIFTDSERRPIAAIINVGKAGLQDGD